MKNRYAILTAAMVTLSVMVGGGFAFLGAIPALQNPEVTELEVQVDGQSEPVIVSLPSVDNNADGNDGATGDSEGEGETAEVVALQIDPQVNALPSLGDNNEGEEGGTEYGAVDASFNGSATEVCTSSVIVGYAPGVRKNGTNINAARMDATLALGEAQDNDTVNFVSLGFGGMIILEFRPGVIENGDGDDLVIYETTFNDKNRAWEAYPEQALVSVSQDGLNWFDLGTTRKDMSFDLGDLAWAKYVRLIDTSDSADFRSPTADGFDVDSIMGLGTCGTQPQDGGDDTAQPTDEPSNPPADVTESPATDEPSNPPADVTESPATEAPTDVPTAEVTESPATDEPTDVPPAEVTQSPPSDTPETTPEPTDVPTEEPTEEPTQEPTDEPDDVVNVPQANVPGEVCLGLSQYSAGTDIEGMSFALNDVNMTITAVEGDVIVLYEGEAPVNYGAPNGVLGANGNLGVGFGDPDIRRHDYVFNFDAPVSQFALNMLDYGDFNPVRATSHLVAVRAYDANGVLVSEDILSYTSENKINPRNSTPYGDLLYDAGDAFTAVGQPGNRVYNVSGAGIVRVEVQYEHNGNGDQSAPSDTNIAIGELCVTPDDVPPPVPSEGISPILECVAPNGDGSWTAYFGYLNRNDVTVEIPVGPNNRFTGTQDRGQTTVFEPGRSPYYPDTAYSFIFSEDGNIVWTLKSPNGSQRTATVNKNSQRCKNYVYPDKTWLDTDGNEISAPGNLDNWSITYTSSIDTMVCSYVDGALSCDSDGKLDVLVGETFSVTETALDGWTPANGVGAGQATGVDCVLGAGDLLDKECEHTVVNQQVPPPVVEPVCSAQAVVSYVPGTNRNGTSIAANRMDPTKALGPAQDDDTLNFVSLGFNLQEQAGVAELVLDFAPYVIVNGAGMDVRVTETSYGDRNRDWTRYPEQADVYASEDGVNWVYIGNARKDGDFDLGSLATARYIKLVDVTDPSQMRSGTMDAFDVDAVEAYACDQLPDPTPTPTPTPVVNVCDTVYYMNHPSSQLYSVSFDGTYANMTLLSEPDYNQSHIGVNPATA